jgi:ABC-2 type transport system ATP-binding protein
MHICSYENQQEDRDTVISVEKLTKEYPSGYLSRKKSTKLAVEEIDFEVKRGEIFGLLGPNGAGKTTTIKMLTTLLLPTSGRATVLGMNVEKEVMEIRKRINLVMGGERGLYYRITGRQNLQFFSNLYKVPPEIREQRIDELVELVGMADAADKRVEDYSRGMKQRIHLARGLVNDPEILFLDEPTIGLDPEIAREMRLVIKDMACKGRTVLLSTHDMLEAEFLCDRIALISKGHIVALGSPSELKELVERRSIVEIELEGLTEDMVSSIETIQGVEAVSSRFNNGRNIIRVQVEIGTDMISTIAAQLRGSRLIRITTEEPSLEDAFIALVRR